MFIRHREKDKKFMTTAKYKISEGSIPSLSAATSGKTYVGQSKNIPKRLKQHMKSGKLQEGTVVTKTEVTGGKTSREIQEQRRINSLGGVRNLENKINPIGPNRSHLLNQ